MNKYTLNEIEDNLGVYFNNHTLLKTALTHSSFGNQFKDAEYNERLEFLGDPGRGMPLLAPVRAILREPLLDHGQIRVDHRRARLSHRRHGRQILLREVLTHRRLADMCFPRDRRDGFPVPPQTTDRLYLGHADHNPFRSFLAEIQAPSS